MSLLIKLLDYALMHIKITMLVGGALIFLVSMIYIVSEHVPAYSIWRKIATFLDELANFLLVTLVVIAFFEFLFILYQVTQLMNYGGF
ncbi:hypothetical protein [uncultured Lactobacillus sp.]|uniref:hypothetical protein n=1 Tax=uncultured Lactobacillus sp. TaxID=153152 RepID=UPI00259AF591|nr:hypothetical protein [uncultured Lactobacillus sp.]